MTKTKKTDRTELIKLRVTPAQKSTVVNNATKSGDTLSDYVKSKLGLEKTTEEKKEDKKSS